MPISHDRIERGDIQLGCTTSYKTTPMGPRNYTRVGDHPGGAIAQHLILQIA